MAGTSVELVSAYVSLVPSLKGSEKAIGRELSSPAVQQSTRKSGRSLGGVLMSGIKTAGKVAAVGVGALLATSLGMGFKRLKGIENARASLGGLGHDAKSVDAIMDNALNAVKGTSFGMDEAAKVAASSVAAGIKPGKALEGNLRLVADAATIGGSSLGEMGAIFNKVATSNKVQGDTINQLNQRGIPIIQLLAKELGVSGEEVTALSKKGKIDFATFQKAMEAGMGGASLKSADTFSGALANTGAALARFGATVLSGVFPSMKVGLGGIIEIIDKATTAIEPFAKAVGKKLGKALEVAVDWIGKLEAKDFSSFPAFLEKIGLNGGKTSKAFSSIGDSVVALMPAFKEFGKTLPKVGGAIGKLAGAGLTVLTSTLSFLADNIDTIIAIMPLLVAGFVAWKVAAAAMNVVMAKSRMASALSAPVFLASNALRLTAVRLEGRNAAALAASTTAQATNTGAQKVSLLTRGKNTVAMIAQKTATVASTVATKTATVAQKALNLVLRANPIGLIITAIGLLVGAIVVLYKKNDTAKRIIDGAWIGIKNAFKGTISFFTDKLIPDFKTGAKQIGDFFKSLGRGITKTVDFWIVKPFKAVAKFITVTLPNAFKLGKKVASLAFKILGNAVTSTTDKYIVKPFKAVKTFITKTIPAAFNLGKKLVRLAWLALGNVVRDFWNSKIKPPFTAVKNFITKTIPAGFTAGKNKVRSIWLATGKIISDFWNTKIKPPFDAVKKFITKTIPAGFTLGKNKVKSIWSALGSGLKSIYDKTIRKPFDAVKKLITVTVPDGFRKGVDIIKRVWKKVANAARTPINFVIKSVYNNGLKKAFNTIADTLKLPDKWRLPHAAEIKPFKAGGFTGPGGINEAAGVVHRGEHVIKQVSRKKLERTNPGALDWINEHGTMPGYKRGGLVNPMPRQYRNISAGLYGYPGHAGTDYPAPVGTVVRSPGKGTVANTGWNLSGGTGKQVWINHINGLMSRVHHLSKILVHKGQGVNQGTPVGRVGMTGNTTGPHAHWGVMDGRRYLNPASVWGSSRSGSGNFYGGGKSGPADGGRSNMLSKFLNPLKSFGSGMFDKLKSKFPDSILRQIGVGGAKRGLSGVKDFIKNKGIETLEKLKDTASSVWSWGKNALGFGNTKDKVRHVAKGYGWNKGAQWKALSNIIQKESGWDLTAKNPHSSAEGLFQKMTSIHGKVSKTAEGQARWGLHYMKGRYGDPIKAWNYWQKNRHYAKGGLVDPEELTAGRAMRAIDPHRHQKFDDGGYLQPGITPAVNATGKPEPVFTSGQWDTLGKADGGGGDTYHVNVEIRADDLAGLSDIEQFFNEIRRKARQKAGAN